MHNQLREPQPYEDCQAKSIQEFGWTSQGIDWGWGQGIKSTTHRRVEEFVYSCHQRRLTWAKKKKNWTVAQWSKVLFSDESKFCISFGNQGPRVWRKGGEAHSPSCLKSSVKFPQSLMIWVQCHLLCWSIVFFENDPMTAVVPRVKGFACYSLSFSRHNKNIKMEHFFLYILSRYFIWLHKWKGFNDICASLKYENEWLIILFSSV